MTSNKGPDLRGWVALGLFALTAYVITLLALNPKLAESQLFATVTTAIVTSGLIGGVVAWLYGSSKGSDDKTVLLAAKTGAPEPLSPPPAPAPPIEPPAE